MHRDIISELLSAGSSDICDQQNEPEPLTKLTMWVYSVVSTVCVHVTLTVDCVLFILVHLAITS